MARDTFNLLWRYLHLQNNEELGPQGDRHSDKLFKIRWFVNYLNNKFQSVYMPYGQFSLDESMVKFKGRLGFRQYMPAKPIKWGVKIWSLCEADTGYLYNFQIYTGKDEGVQEKGLSHRVVMDLCTPLFGTSAHIYMDNYYSSVPLFHDLHVHGILACGTVRANRKGLPNRLLPKNCKLQRHEFKLAQKDEITFCLWQDTKPVLFFSNFHSPNDTGLVSRRNNVRKKVNVTTPSVVSDYQINMGGVDRMDQMIHYYMINHRSRKWWRRIFFSLTMSCAHNAYICAKDEYPLQSRNHWPNFQDFIEDLSEALIGDTRAKKAVKVCNIERPVLEHKIEKLFPKRKICRECSLAASGTAKRPGATNFGCVQCNIPVHVECQSKHIMRCYNV